MRNVHGMARLGVLAVGLGMGAGWAQTPVASADSSGDWLSSIDSLLSGASPAPAAPLDLFISFDGTTIFASGNATGNTFTGSDSFAIAYGDGADAEADGTGGLAIADGSGADAFSVGGIGDVAEAVGTNANADAGAYSMGPIGADYDTAIDVGNNSVPATPLRRRRRLRRELQPDRRHRRRDRRPRHRHRHRQQHAAPASPVTTARSPAPAD